MSRRIVSLLLLLSLLFTLAGAVRAERPAAPGGEEKARPASPRVVEPDPIIQLMMDQVSTETVSLYDRQLAGEEPIWIDGEWYTIPTRYTYSGAPIDKTTRWAGEHLANLGMDVEYHVWNNSTNPNVIGTITGTLNPDDIFIICGHIDAVSTTPGADDDASGSTGVLVAADIMSRYEWGCTLRFALWTGEEQWMLGSTAYAERARQRGENIVGLLNLDMIAWNTPASPPVIELHSTPDLTQSLELAYFFSDVVGAYNIPLTPTILNDGEASDQLPFWERGYNAIFAIEDTTNDFNPYYHEPGDNTAHTDLQYFTNYVKAGLGAFAHMAGCLLPRDVGYLDGHVTDSGGNPIDGARVTATGNDGRAYPALADPTGYYTRTLLSGAYTVTASAYGYLPDTVVGVTVQTDTVTTQDFSLLSAPFYTVSGAVTEVGTGAPLYARVTFQGSPTTVWTDPATGFYQAAVAEGAYTMQVKADLHRAQSRAIVVDHDQGQDFQLEPLPCILLVDDDQNNPDVRNYYTSALDALGRDYDLWDIAGSGSPALEELRGYRQVFWFTGYPYNNTFTGENEAVVAAYLDDGGAFFLSSQDYLFEMHLSPFGRQYLHIGNYANDTGQTVVTGANPYAGLGPYTLAYPFNNYADVVNPDAAGMVAFTGDSGNAAVAYDGTFHTVFLGFPFEAIPNVLARADVLEATSNLFGACECNPVYRGAMEWSPTTPIAGQPVSFTGAASGTLPIAFTWAFGDGGVGGGPTPSHVYAQPGAYTVVMTATNCVTASLVVTGTITVEPAPCDPVQDADFSWAPLSPVAGQEVTLNGVANGTPPFTFTWNLGDGARASGTPIAHTYASAGDYWVTMTATNACGQQLAGYTLTIRPACAPVSGVSLAWTPPVPLAGEVVTLTATASGTTPISFTWEMGDGSPLLMGETVTHSYAAGGTYTVSLLAVNACGQERITQGIPISAPPCVPVQQLAFSWTPVTPTAGQPITGTAVASGTAPITFSWAFGDGGEGSGANVTYTLALAGSYSITVTAANRCGQVELAQEITVVAPPGQGWRVYLPVVVKGE